MESVINKAIEWFKVISETTKELTSGNVSHKACTIRGMANRSAEYLEKHKGNLSVVRWQTGEPTESGEHLVTLLSGKVRLAEFYKYKVADKEYWGCIPHDLLCVKAWCKLSDIEPYKEETK